MKVQVEIKGQVLKVAMNGVNIMTIGGLDHDQAHETQVNLEKLR